MQKKPLLLLIIGSIVTVVVALFIFVFFFMHLQCHAPKTVTQILVQADTKTQALIADFKADYN